MSKFGRPFAKPDPRFGTGASRFRKRRGFSLRETGGPNQLSFDSEFDNAYWAKNNSAVAANDTLAPDSTLTADKVTAASTTTAVGVYKAIAVDLGESEAIFAKAGTCSIVALIDTTTGGAWAQFDLAAGTVLGSANCTATIENFGGGWYRVSAKSVTAAGGFFIAQLLDASVAGNPWTTGTCTGGRYLHLWHARLYA